MKLKRAICMVLVLVAVALRLPAQQSEADRKLQADIRAKAEKGDADSQFQLGLMMRDNVEAARWYREAAKQNNAKAQYLLGLCYHEGQGVAKNDAEAVKWYRKAAEQNYADAQHSLGVCYAIGVGVAKNSDEATKWYRKAAEQNDAAGQNELGACFLYGRGVVKDEEEAVNWFRKAAEQDFDPAEYNLALCYAKGEGVGKDDTEAVKWYRKAAEQNNAKAQYNLGRCYFFGDGVVKDFVESYKWTLLAAAQGDEVAKKVTILQEEKMSLEQIAEGQKLAREFKTRKHSSILNSTTLENTTVSGTGFFMTVDGFLITNEHVVNGATQIRLVTSTGLISAKVMKVDAANDLALLKAEGIPQGGTALSVAASRGVKLGGTVATVGFPNIGLQGFAPKLAKGEIASLSGAGDDARYFQISVPVQPGNSGGALVDERGNVVGVVSAKLSARAALASSGSLPENVNYAIKSSYLLSFLESVPEVSAKLKEPNTKEKKFEDVVKEAEQAAVLVLVY